MHTTEQIAVASSRPGIRARLHQLLRSLGYEARAGEPTTAVLSDPHLRALLIDLREQPGMDLLRTAAETRPDVRVLGIGYPETPEEIVAATDLGVEQFLAGEDPEDVLRAAVAEALDVTRKRSALYDVHVRRARESLRRHAFREAEAHARRAAALDFERAEAYNLLGVVREATLHREEALRFYRIALLLDPTYELAKRNAQTATQVPGQRGPAEFE